MSAWPSTVRWKAITGASASFSRAILLRGPTTSAARHGTASVRTFLIPSACPSCEGRDFTDQDTGQSPPVAVVNQTFVKRFFPNQDPIGKHFGIDCPSISGSFEIVGVFRRLQDEQSARRVQARFSAAACAARSPTTWRSMDLRRNAIDVHQFHDPQLQHTRSRMLSS